MSHPWRKLPSRVANVFLTRLHVHAYTGEINTEKKAALIHVLKKRRRKDAGVCCVTKSIPLFLVVNNIPISRMVINHRNMKERSFSHSSFYRHHCLEMMDWCEFKLVSPIMEGNFEPEKKQKQSKCASEQMKFWLESDASFKNQPFNPHTYRICIP